MLNRIVLVDLSITRRERTRVTAFIRDGFRLKAISSTSFDGAELFEVARIVARLCSDHAAVPLIEEGFGGTELYGMVMEILGQSWNPVAPVRDTRIRNL